MITWDDVRYYLDRTGLGAKTIGLYVEKYRETEFAPRLVEMGIMAPVELVG